MGGLKIFWGTTKNFFWMKKWGKWGYLEKYFNFEIEGIKKIVKSVSLLKKSH